MSPGNRAALKEEADMLKTEAPCVRCWKPTRLTFACPCDLFHPLCATCGRKVERLDCAHITGPQILRRCGERSCLNPAHLATEEGLTQ